MLPGEYGCAFPCSPVVPHDDGVTQLIGIASVRPSRLSSLDSYQTGSAPTDRAFHRPGLPMTILIRTCSLRYVCACTHMFNCYCYWFYIDACALHIS